MDIGKGLDIVVFQKLFSKIKRYNKNSFNLESLLEDIRQYLYNNNEYTFTKNLDSLKNLKEANKKELVDLIIEDMLKIGELTSLGDNEEEKEHSKERLKEIFLKYFDNTSNNYENEICSYIFLNYLSMQYTNNPRKDDSIPKESLLKLLTIKNYINNEEDIFI